MSEFLTGMLKIVCIVCGAVGVTAWLCREKKKR